MRRKGMNKENKKGKDIRCYYLFSTIGMIWEIWENGDGGVSI